MKRYLTIKNFRNINPIAIDDNTINKKENELKYGRLYLNGDVREGTLISIIGSNGTGKTNVLSAIEKTFTGNIDDKKDNPKIDGFINYSPELNVYIESNNGILYKGKSEDGEIVWNIGETNNAIDIIIKYYMSKIINNIFMFKNNNNYYYNHLFYVYENNYKIDNNKTEFITDKNKSYEEEDNNNEKENIFYNEILNYAVEKTIETLNKYKEYKNINQFNY